MRRFDRLELDEKKTHVEADTSATQQQSSSSHLDEAARDETHWMRLADEARRNGQHETALRYYSRALESDRGLVAGWCGQVRMLIALGEYPEADLWSKKALELFKNNPDLLAARTQAQCRTGDLRNAQASCDAAIAQPGPHAYPWLARGELMLARRDPIEAYCLDKAVQLDGDWIQRIEIADVYLHYGRATKAVVRLREAVERAPGQAHAWFRLGECEQALGLTDAAARSWQRCLQVEPKHVDARNRLHFIARDKRPVKGLLRRLFRR